MNLLDLADKNILNVIEYLDFCDLFLSVRQVCQRLKCIIDDFIHLKGIFLLASERDDFDTRMPIEILYVLSKDSNKMVIFRKTLPPFPNPCNSYDTEDYQVRHMSDIGMFGTVVDTNRIVIGLYCKERWTSLRARVGNKEHRRKLTPKPHTENRDRKIFEGEIKHCIYWSKNDGEDSEDESAAKIFTANKDKSHKNKEMIYDTGSTESEAQKSPRFSLDDKETNDEDKYLLVPYLYEFSYTSEKWRQIELSAIQPLIYANDIQCQMAFRENEDSIFVELKIGTEGVDDSVKTCFVKFNRNENFKTPGSFPHETLRPIDSLQNFTANSTLCYQSGLCDISEDIISFYEINQRWYDQGLLQNYGNERKCEDVCVSSQDHYKSLPTNFFKLNENIYFIKQVENALTIQKYCPRLEKFSGHEYMVPPLVKCVDKILTSANENFAIIFGFSNTKEERNPFPGTENNPIVIIFTEKDGVQDMNINLSHYSCNTGILMRIK